MGQAFRRSSAKESASSSVEYTTIQPESMGDVIVELEGHHGRMVTEYAAHVDQIEFAIRECQRGIITREKCKAMNRQHNLHTARLTQQMELISAETSLYSQQIRTARRFATSVRLNQIIGYVPPIAIEFIHSLELDDQIDRMIDRRNVNIEMNASIQFVIGENATYSLYAESDVEDDDGDHGGHGGETGSSRL